MSLTIQLDADRVKMNYHAKYLGQRSLCWKVIVQTDWHEYDWVLYLDH